MTRKSCDICANWTEPGSGQETGKCQLPSVEPGWLGEGDAISDWPHTKPTDWCAKHQIKVAR